VAARRAFLTGGDALKMWHWKTRTEKLWQTPKNKFGTESITENNELNRVAQVFLLTVLYRLSHRLFTFAELINLVLVSTYHAAFRYFDRKTLNIVTFLLLLNYVAL